MKQRKHTATILMIVLLVLQSSSSYAMHFIQENLHTLKESWDNSEGWVKGAIIGTSVVLGYVAWNERRHYLKDMRITQLEDELAKKQKSIDGNHSEIGLLKLKVNCVERAENTITRTFWQRDVTSFIKEPSAEICIELFDIVKTNMEVKDLDARVTQLEDRAANLEGREEYFNSVISSLEVRYQHFEGKIKQVEECMNVAAESTVVRNDTVRSLAQQVRGIKMKLLSLEVVNADMKELIRIANGVKELIKRKNNISH